MRKPSPRHVKTECSVCGQDWGAHERAAKAAKRKEPNADDCVTVLMDALNAEVGRKELRQWPSTSSATGASILNAYGRGFQ